MYEDQRNNIKFFTNKSIINSIRSTNISHQKKRKTLPTKRKLPKQQKQNFTNKTKINYYQHN